MKRNLLKDKRGLIAQLAVGIPLILVTAIIWLVSMMPIDLYWEAMAPNMPVSAHGTMTLLNNVAGWVLLIEVIGLLVWLAAWAQQKEVVDVPA